MKHMRIGGLALMLLLTAVTNTRADEDATVLSSGHREHLALTIYQNNLAFVDEARRNSSGSEEAQLVISGVSPRLIPGSVSVNSPSSSVSRLDLALNPLSQIMLLQAHVGREIGVIWTHPTTGAETIERAHVLSIANGVVLEINGRIETGVPGRLVFDEIPAHLKHRPAVVAHLSSSLPDNSAVGIRYLTDGIGWRADHVVNVAETDGDAETIQLETWATLTNNTGLVFDKTSLSLVAGSFNRETMPQPMARTETMMLAAAPAAVMDTPVRESLGDYHLYRVPDTVDLGTDEPVQVRLTHVREFKGRRTYVLTGDAQSYFSRHGQGMVGQENPVVIHRFKNTGGEPIPTGIARVYANAPDDTTRYLGEDRLNATPDGGMVSLHTGRSFDVTARRRQTRFRIIGENARKSESDHEIRLENAMRHAVVVEVRENIPGDWHLLQASHDMVRDGMAAVWQVAVPAGGDVALTYSVRVTR